MQSLIHKHQVPQREGLGTGLAQTSCCEGVFCDGQMDSVGWTG